MNAFASSNPSLGYWTQSGIDFVCQNFGDTNQCCVEDGLTFSYIESSTGTEYQETGGTAQVVGRFTLGIIDSLTMINPDRGTFTPDELHNANGEGGVVTPTMAQEITAHDSPSEDQWCYSGGAEGCTNPTGYEGQTKCGNTAYGQDPTHLYQCTDGSWTDQGYNQSCDQPSDCTNPPAGDGQTICGDSNYGQDPTHRYQCNDGTWTDQGYDANCDAGPADCTNPPGNDGQTICGNTNYGQDSTHRYRCNNGTWQDLGYDTMCDSSTTPCEQIANSNECVAAGCYWYANTPWEAPSCHTNAQAGFNYLPLILLGVGGAVAIGAVYFISKKSKAKTTTAKAPTVYMPIYAPKKTKRKARVRKPAKVDVWPSV